MTDFPHDHPHVAPRNTPQDWLIAIATALLAFVLLGIVPRLFW